MSANETIVLLGGIGSFIGGLAAIVSAFLSAKAAKASSKSAKDSKEQGNGLLANFREQIEQLETHNTTLYTNLEVNRQAVLLPYLLTEFSKLESLNLEIQRMTENSSSQEEVQWEAKNFLRTQNSILGYAVRFNDPNLKNQLKKSRDQCADIVNKTITDSKSIAEITCKAIKLIGVFDENYLEPRRLILEKRISEIENSIETGFSGMRNS